MDYLHSNGQFSKSLVAKERFMAYLTFEFAILAQKSGKNAKMVRICLLLLHVYGQVSRLMSFLAIDFAIVAKNAEFW